MKNLFIDIETAPLYASLEEYPEALRTKLEERYGEEAYDRAALHAEYGKIVCISVGMASHNHSFRSHSYTGDEKELLTRFSYMRLNDCRLVGHNILDFDLPFIQRRMVIHGIQIPARLVTAGRKPWELESVFSDTMVMWSSTQWKYRASLNVLCEILDIPSPKSDMDGSMVGKAFYRGEIDRIAAYCEEDVRATHQVYAHLSNHNM